MRICIIGNCGGHIGSVFDTKIRCNYVGISDTHGEEYVSGFLQFAKSKGYDIPYFEDWKKMLEKLKPDIAAVDCVFSEHAEIAKFALEHGIHVFCEKPLATTLKQLKALELASSNTKAALFSMFTARFDPWFYTAKMLVDGGAIGKIRMLSAQKSYKLGYRPDFFKVRDTYGGTISWVAIHMIDQILWISGKPCKTVFARHSATDNCGHGDLETSCMIHMELEDTILANVTADYYRPGNAPTHGDDRIRIVGTKGILEVIGDKVFLVNSENDEKEPVSLLKPESIFDGFMNVVNKSENPIYNGCDGLYSTYIALSARESADTGNLITL